MIQSVRIKPERSPERKTATYPPVSRFKLSRRIIRNLHLKTFVHFILNTRAIYIYIYIYGCTTKLLYTNIRFHVISLSHNDAANIYLEKLSAFDARREERKERGK